MELENTTSLLCTEEDDNSSTTSSVLGSGTDGKVIIIDDHVVEKIYAESEYLDYSVLREIDFYAKTHNLNLPFVKTYDWGYDASTKRYYLRMKRYYITLDEYILDNNLTTCTKSITRTAYNMAHDIIQALDFLHSNNMMHRDIKASNVLMSASYDNFVLADMCRCGYNDYTRFINMTTEYCAAPEVNPENFNEGFYSDMYSFGDMLGRTLCLIPSYVDRINNWNEHISKFKQLCIQQNINDFGLSDLVLQLTSHDPTLRPTAKQCAKLLNIHLHEHTPEYLSSNNNNYKHIPYSAYKMIHDITTFLEIKYNHNDKCNCRHVSFLGFTFRF
jgi:serine/threonine protein kinase